MIACRKLPSDEHNRSPQNGCLRSSRQWFVEHVICDEPVVTERKDHAINNGSNHGTQERLSPGENQ